RGLDLKKEARSFAERQETEDISCTVFRERPKDRIPQKVLRYSRFLREPVFFDYLYVIFKVKGTVAFPATWNWI
ncbi:hypothetical protein, partial [Faecalibaculum rodentium]|uniref:hypothetical protein n=1 Tax=Faecalibaculum rodentium TaxID=1702221 RepID=UPI0023F3004B